MIGLLGKKLGQTRVYNDQGQIVPVTVIQAGPNRVLQKKSVESDGYEAVQLGFDDQSEKRINKPMAGHLLKQGKSAAVTRIKEFRNFSLDVKPGDTVGANIFAAGDHVDAIGVTKGRGFQGVVKRYNFGGGPRTHGQKGWFRRTGSIAAGSTPGWVDKGKKMPGHMGQVRRTVQNLEIVQVREDDNLILVKGSVPGANGDYVVLREAKKKPKKA
jgi:large subunit ribosomal protein L3